MPPVYTSLSARCCRNALSTVVRGRSAGNRRMFARTISADAGPLATSKEMSNWNPLGCSSNLTMGTRALAISWIFCAMPRRDTSNASALRHTAGDWHPLPRITASMSLLGRYIPVAKDPCTSNRDSGHSDRTAARTRSTAAWRAAPSACVGSRKRQKSTISECRRTSGDFSLRSRSAVPDGHHSGSDRPRPRPPPAPSPSPPPPPPSSVRAPASSLTSDSPSPPLPLRAGLSVAAATTGCMKAPGGSAGSSPKSIKSSPRPMNTGSLACSVAVPPMRCLGVVECSGVLASPSKPVARGGAAGVPAVRPSPWSPSPPTGARRS
mmetsp:Transcript_24556/g.61161  ORF Transcript_24556/g.61161 Transcript_24556/m.61161 type:complete len:322 (+) Transcript_24556:767-1732(+)